MAFTSEIGVFVVSVNDSMLAKGSEVVQNFAAPTNECDKDINLMICLTVLGVCFFVCVTVFACVTAISRIKRNAKAKEYELEIQKLNKKEENLKLQYHNDILNQEYKLKKALLEIDKQKVDLDFEKLKNKWEVDKQKDEIEIAYKKEIWELDKDREVWKLNTNIAIANAVIKTQREWLESIEKSQK